MKDYYNREIKIEDTVNLDYQSPPSDSGVVVGFTAKKVKVYNLYHDRILNIYPQNLTLIKNEGV